jgi:hypothetical protein
MRDQPQNEISEADLEKLRGEPDAVAVISSLLGVREMGPADHLQTEHEVRDYVRHGQPQEAHALIHQSRLRRESWEREQSQVESRAVE